MSYFKISKFFLFASVFFVALVTGSTLFPFIVGKYIWFRSCVDLAFIFFLLGLLFQDKEGACLKKLKEVFKNKIAITVSVFTAIFLLAGFFGVNPAASFWSNFERGEGGLQILHLFIFFVLLLALFKEEKDWQKIFIFSLVAGLLMTFYGVGASLKYIDAKIAFRTNPNGNGMEYEQVLTGEGGPFYQTFKSFIGSPFNQKGFRFSGSIGNPAYVAVYSIFMMFYALYILAKKYKNRYRSIGAIILYFLLAVFLAVFIGAATRGAFIGLIAAVIAFAVYSLYSKKHLRGWLFSGIAVLILIVSIFVYFKDAPFVRAIPGSRIFDISFTAETFQDRVMIWKIAIDGWKERPFLGWGPENFIQVFAKDFNTDYFSPGSGFGAWFDRDHSIFFDYLVEAGILGLLSYFSIFAVFYWQMFKKNKIAEISNQISRDKNQYNSDGYKQMFLSALIFAVPIVYLVQGLVIFDVLPTYFNLFLFLAFAAYYFDSKNQINPENKFKK
jgi:hypothetical protein